MLDVSVFRNLRFSAASISIACVFFALMGVMYVLTMYMQSVLGYSALQAGVKMLPIAIGMVLASKLAIGLTRRLGTKFSVTLGLATRRRRAGDDRDVRHGHDAASRSPWRSAPWVWAWASRCRRRPRRSWARFPAPRPASGRP